jgi:hypothetical protein
MYEGRSHFCTEEAGFLAKSQSLAIGVNLKITLVDYLSGLQECIIRVPMYKTHMYT